MAEAAWPRYNNRTGTGGDANRNGMGHSGYGCYGLNVAVGDIDDDPQREIIVTYDNHHIQAFDPNGEAIDWEKVTAGHRPGTRHYPVKLLRGSEVMTLSLPNTPLEGTTWTGSCRVPAKWLESARQ